MKIRIHKNSNYNKRINNKKQRLITIHLYKRNKNSKIMNLMFIYQLKHQNIKKYLNDRINMKERLNGLFGNILTKQKILLIK